MVGSDPAIRAPRPAAALGAWLERMLSAAEPGQRLPPHTQLARTWGISPVTVRRALRGFKADGRIECAPGRGTRVPPLLPDTGALASPGRRSVETIADAVLRLISTGALKRGDALPAVKAVCAQHRVTPATVCRAYRSLAEQGLVSRVGRRYWVGGLDTGALVQGSRFVHFFYHASATADEFLDRIQYGQAVAEMEAELQSLRIRMVFDRAEALEGSLARWRAAGESPVGIVVASEDMTYFRAVSPVLERFLSARMLHKPRVLLAGTRSDRRSRLLMHFAHGHIPTVKARAVVRFCRDQRFAELCVVVGDPRPRDSALRDSFRLLGELSGEAPGLRVRYVVRRNEHVADPAGLVALVRSSWPDDYMLSIMGRRGEQGLLSLADLVTVVGSLDEWYAQAGPRSLWYFLDDRRAGDALAWCRDHRVPVPSRAAILSSTDTSRCHHQGISACVTDWRTIGYLLAHALVGDIPVARTTKGYIRTNVRVFERLTTP